MRASTIVLLSALAIGLGGLAPSVATADDRAWIVASAGVFNIAAEDKTPRDSRELELGLEWRGRPGLVGLRPNVGAMVHAESGGYLFAGLRRDFELGSAWGLSLGFAAGLFEDGDGIDLGGAVEFRSSIEIFARLGERSRLGLDFYHLSNAGIYEPNPGANSLVLVYGRRID